MLIAKINDFGIDQIIEHSALFPNVSFPETGPSLDWLEEHGCLPVISFQEYDRDTQKYMSVDPYIDGDTVLTFTITNLTQDELDQKTSKELQDKRNMMVISRFQARAALFNSGLLDLVEQLMLDPSVDGLTKLAWKEVSEFRRTSPAVLSIAKKLNLNDTQLDDLFDAASKITI